MMGKASMLGLGMYRVYIYYTIYDFFFLSKGMTHE